VFGIAAAGDLETVEREVSRGGQDIAAATGVKPRWYRAATGFYSRAAMQPIRDLGYGLAGYSLNADMGASLPARAVAGRVAGAVAGDVIVAHINQPRRSSGLGVIAGLRVLKSRGARFVRLDRLGPADVVYA
jgi:peptidoglycan/xylan/chitin deacetylase (PgdA/CDA1 family)